MTTALPMTAAPAMDFAETSTAATTVWLADLARHEESINRERRMKAYATAARVVDRQTGVVTIDPDLAADAALRDAMGDLAAWSAYAGEARAMVALLDAALTTIAAIPVEDFGAWNRAGGIWTRLRHAAGKVRPLPPLAPWRDWRWEMSLRAWGEDGYRRHMIVCRQRFRLLAPPGRRAVAEEYGIRDVDDILHRVYPVAERDALDERAKALGIYTGLQGVARPRWR